MRALASRQSQPFIFIGGVDALAVDPADFEALLIGLAACLRLLIALGRVVSVIGYVTEQVAIEAAPLVECWAAGLEFWGEVIVRVVGVVMRL